MRLQGLQGHTPAPPGVPPPAQRPRALSPWRASRSAKLASLWRMRISELARLTGVTVHALRHYERAGLLRPARLPNGYRDYAGDARREVVFIAMSRALGFGVPQIRSHLLAWRRGRIGPGGLADAVLARADEIAAQIAALQAQHRQALEHAQWLRARQAEQDARAAANAANAAQAARAPWPRVRRRSTAPAIPQPAATLTGDHP